MPNIRCTTCAPNVSRSKNMTRKKKQGKEMLEIAGYIFSKFFVRIVGNKSSVKRTIENSIR